jgi:hypothetical protein
VLDYYEEASDPDIVILRRQDGSFAAPFSARESPQRRQGDYCGVIEAEADLLSLRGDGDLKRSA